MRLEYKILWVDDNKTGLEDIFDPHLKDFIEDMGFIMKLYEARSESDLNQILEKTQNFDFIFMDYTFDDADKGAEFIKNIRGKGIYSNILFYSALGSEELKKISLDDDLQGIFVQHRRHILRDIDKIKEIIRFNLMKNIDKNAMRGILMSEVAVFDEKILELINKFKNQGIDEELTTFTRAKAESFYNRVNSLNDNKLLRQINGKHGTIYFGSSARAEFLSKNILSNKFSGNTSLEEFANIFINKFCKEIILVRNDLAHKIKIVKTEEELTEIRKKIIDHRKNFEEINRILEIATNAKTVTEVLTKAQEEVKNQNFVDIASKFIP